jgi:hypothetical protein
MIHVELAQLALHIGNTERHQRELHQAHRLCTEIGAAGHAQRITDQLATAAT